MRWLRCDFDALMSLPDGYLDMVVEEVKAEAEAREQAKRATALGR